MFGEEEDGFGEGADGAGDFLIGEDAGEANAGVIVDSDVERFGAGALIAVRAITGGADSWFGKASEFFNIEVDEFTRSIALIAQRRRRSGQ